MWPNSTGVGNFASVLHWESMAADERAGKLKHFCYYNVLRKSVRNVAEGSSWEERCRCGRLKRVDHKFNVVGDKSPERTIRWYDAEGHLERVTGDK